MVKVSFQGISMEAKVSCSSKLHNERQHSHIVNLDKLGKRCLIFRLCRTCRCKRLECLFGSAFKVNLVWLRDDSSRERNCNGRADCHESPDDHSRIDRNEYVNLRQIDSQPSLAHSAKIEQTISVTFRRTGYVYIQKDHV